jgi:hypothetical protein
LDVRSPTIPRPLLVPRTTVAVSMGTSARPAPFKIRGVLIEADCLASV